MATQFAAEKNLIAEIEDRIVDIVPEHDPQIRFRPRSDAEMSSGNFETALRAPRMFEIRDAETIGVPYIGKGVQSEEVNYPISIWYPTTSRLWRFAARSDFAKIRLDIMSNATTVTGVQNRWFPKDTILTLEKLEDDPWFIATSLLRVMYEFTG